MTELYEQNFMDEEQRIKELLNDAEQTGSKKSFIDAFNIIELLKASPDGVDLKLIERIEGLKPKFITKFGNVYY